MCGLCVACAELPPPKPHWTMCIDWGRNTICIRYFLKQNGTMRTSENHLGNTSFHCLHSTSSCVTYVVAGIRTVMWNRCGRLSSCVHTGVSMCVDVARCVLLIILALATHAMIIYPRLHVCACAFVHMCKCACVGACMYGTWDMSLLHTVMWVDGCCYRYAHFLMMNVPHVLTCYQRTGNTDMWHVLWHASMNWIAGDRDQHQP